MGDRPPGVIGLEPSHGTRLDSDATLGAGAGGTTRGPTGTSAPAALPAGLTIRGWPRKISWDEFNERSARPSGVDEDAEIHSEGGGDDNMAVGRSGGHYRIESMTITLSVESDSWVVTSKKSDQLLSHEQGHFDITGLLWRDLAGDILRIRARSTTALKNEIDRLMTRAKPVFKRVTDAYDTETNHSQNRDAQKKWDDKIRDAIDKGTRFASN